MSEFKVEIKPLARAIFLKAFLPQAVMVGFIYFIHLALTSLWLYLNYEDNEPWRLTLISLLGGGLTLVAYGLWGVRRLIIKGYKIFHTEVVSHWLQEFCDGTAEKVIKGNYLAELKEQKSSIMEKFKRKVFDRVEKFPSIVKKIVQFVFRKIGLTDDLDEQINQILNKDAKAISESMNEKITFVIFEAVDNAMPTWVLFLIPIDIILFIVLWWL